MFATLSFVGLLHACGDVSSRRRASRVTAPSAPRMWRCFQQACEEILAQMVCSTHVEMFLSRGYSSCPWVGLLHACGDVSIIQKTDNELYESAPRMWRCFYQEIATKFADDVCSTHVEMFPSSLSSAFHSMGLLHACGDVSNRTHYLNSPQMSAPRMWRCFLRNDRFMFLDNRLLHACGDVSAPAGSWRRKGKSAPRMWRCFCALSTKWILRRVCSTHVEMFPSPLAQLSWMISLLHACGDVSLLMSSELYCE